MRLKERKRFKRKMGSKKKFNKIGKNYLEESNIKDEKKMKESNEFRE